MSEHTSGPLVALESDKCICVATGDDRDWIIAEMVIYSTNDPDLNDAVQMANATLYAAAPDLLAACELALAFLNQQGYDARYCDTHGYPILRTILSAISKAEGVPR